MAAPYLGRCLCGGVTFSIASEPLAVVSCFCDHCNKGAGGTNQVIAKFARHDVVVSSGEDLIAAYTLTDTSSGGPKAKSFCKTCGVPLWTIPESAKDRFLLVRPSTLSGGLDLKPEAEIFIKGRPSWVQNLEGVPQWQEGRRG